MIEVKADFDTPFGNKMLEMYRNFTTNPFTTQPVIYKGFEELVKIVYDKYNFEYNDNRVMQILTEERHSKGDNNRVLIGFSGGLDSAYSALSLRDKGYDVTLFHAKSLNKSYPKESHHAMQFAENLGFTLVTIDITHKGKEAYPDNPFKNQLILSYMYDYARQNNISNLMLGADRTTNISDSVIGFTVTDSVNVFDAFMSGLHNIDKNVNLMFIDGDISKFERLRYIINNHKDALDYIYSCIVPHRFNESLHRNNEKKFGIKLLNDRCGSCYKCCMEYILLYELGYYEYNEKMLKHCYEVLYKSPLSHRPDLFDKKLPYETRRKNVLEYMS